jgi:hypothetical protein
MENEETFNFLVAKNPILIGAEIQVSELSTNNSSARGKRKLWAQMRTRLYIVFILSM